MNAFSVVPLFSDPPKGARVSSLDGNNLHIYVGTTDGRLFLYEVEQQQQGSNEPLTAASRRENSAANSGVGARQREVQGLGRGRHPVVALECCGDLARVLTLCDGHLDTWNAFTLQKQLPAFPPLKQVSLFATDRGSPEYRVVAQSKQRRLSFYEFTGTWQSARTDLTLPEPAKALTWYNDKLFVGTGRSYVLYEMAALTAADSIPSAVPLFDFTKGPPLMCLGGVEVILASDLAGIVVDLTGMPTRSALPYAEPPIALAYHYPYFLALESCGIEIHNLETQSLAQHLPLPQDSMKIMCQGRSGEILLSDGGAVLALREVPVSEQIDSLLRAGKASEAVQLFLQTKEKERAARIRPTAEDALIDAREERDLYRRAGKAAFRALRFEDSVKFFAKASEDVRAILLYFPGVLSSTSDYEGKDAHQPAIEKVVTDAFSKLALRGVKPKQSKAQYIADAKICVLRYLEQERSQLMLQVAKAEKARSRSQSKVSLKSGDSSSPVPAMAVAAASNGTAEERSSAASSARTNGTYLEDIDTARAKLYIDVCARKALRELFLVRGVKLNRKDVEIHLIEHNEYILLGLLYASGGEIRKALEIWRKCGDPTEREYEDVANGDGVAESVKLLATSAEAAVLRAGPNDKHTSLLFEFSPWLLQRDPELALTAFTEHLPKPDPNVRRDTPKKAATNRSKFKMLETPPPKHEEFDARVAADFLGNLNPEFRLAFLEYAVNDACTEDEQLHTWLVLSYIQTCNTLISAIEPSEHSKNIFEDGLLGETRKLLQALLQKSHFYSAEQALAAVGRAPLHEELVLLLARLKRHRQALEILVDKICSDERAEKYCAEHSDDDSDLLLALMHVYLLRSDENESSTSSGTLLGLEAEQTIAPSVLRLLERYAHLLSPAKVLEVMPPSVPLKVLYPYLKSAMRRSIHLVRETSVESSLHQQEKLRYSALCATEKQRKIYVDSSRICGVCSKYIGDKVFACFPNNVVVHFKCFDHDSPHIDPITKKNFRNTFEEEQV